MMLDRKHGSPYDRGGADSYYGRGFQPHYYKGDTYLSERVEDLTREQLDEYTQGYQDNEDYGDKKDWGYE